MMNVNSNIHKLRCLSKEEAERFIGLSVEISKMIRVLRRKTGDR